MGGGGGVKERGNVEGIQKYSFIVSRPQDEALRLAGPCGCGPGFVRSSSRSHIRAAEPV